MRYFYFLLASLLISAVAFAANDQLTLATQLAQAGTPQLALQKVDTGQPAMRDDPDWLAWERLRLSLLITLGRSQDILRRTEQLPATLPADFLRDAYLAGAQAALRVGQGEQVRAYLARLLWQLEPAANHALLRRLVLESYLADQRAADAYLVQLRYQQDFPKPDKALLAQLIEVLLNAGMVREAVTWLPQLDDGPLKLLLRLEAGLTAPSLALAEARHALQKNGSPAYWVCVLRVALLQNNVVLAQEAREQLLNMKEPAGAFPVSTQTLRKAYTKLAMDVANQSSLLVGDDAAWMELAARTAATAPVTTRSLLVYLSDAAQTAEMRADAQNKFAASLRDGKLGLVALSVFGQEDVASIAPATRVTLGVMVSEMARPVEAARYWHGLENPPAGFSVQQWQLKRAAVFIGARVFDDAEDALHRLFLIPALLPAEQHAVLQLLLEMPEAGGAKQAERLLKQWLPIAPLSQHKDILFTLGDIAEGNGQYASAGEYFMQVLILAGNRDPAAPTTRFRAAASLAKAGLAEDARRQYQILLTATKDPTQQAAIKRALAQL
jgi:tetratricopeptide (TPR) repeat protein